MLLKYWRLYLEDNFYVNSSTKQEDHSEIAFGKTLQKVDWKEQCESYGFLNDGTIPTDYINWLGFLMLVFKPLRRLKEEKWTEFKARLGSTVSYNSAATNMWDIM